MKHKLFSSIFAVTLSVILALGMTACRKNKKEDEGEKVAPTISEFTITAAEGEAYAKVGATHVVSYKIDGTCTRETLTVRKDGAETDAYTYTTSDKHLIFEAEGNYVVVLTAYNGELYNTASKSLSITTVGGNGGNENEGGEGGGPVVNKPTFGEDPFGGTATDLVTDIGLLLYYDATDVETNITYDNVSYAVTGGSLQNTAKIAYVGAGRSYPYLYSTAAGTAEVTITVTDGDNNAASETKTFTVYAPAAGAKYESYQAYGNAVYGGIGLNLDGGTGDSSVAGRKALVVTKSGVICNRSNSASLNGISGLAYCGALGDNFTLEFDVTLLSNNPTADGWNTILLTLWTGTGIGSDSEAGNFWVNWKADNAIGAGADAKLGTLGSASTAGTATVGAKFHIRLTRSVSGSTATLKLEFKAGTEAYTTLISYTAPTSTVAGNGGSKVINVIIGHLDGGVYAVENVTRTAN